MQVYVISSNNVIINLIFIVNIWKNERGLCTYYE